jgi:hypothetical protein
LLSQLLLQLLLAPDGVFTSIPRGWYVVLHTLLLLLLWLLI